MGVHVIRIDMGVTVNPSKRNVIQSANRMRIVNERFRGRFGMMPFKEA